jgi:hypothetical protein
LIEAAREKIIEIEKEPETTNEADHLFEDDDDLLQQAAQLIQDNDMND